MAREITISDVKSKVDAGWKKQALAEHYGLPMAQMTKLLQAAGLKIRKFHAPLFVLVDDTTPTEGGISVELTDQPFVLLNEEESTTGNVTTEPNVAFPTQEEATAVETPEVNPQTTW